MKEKKLLKMQSLPNWILIWRKIEGVKAFWWWRGAFIILKLPWEICQMPYPGSVKICEPRGMATSSAGEQKVGKILHLQKVQKKLLYAMPPPLTMCPPPFVPWLWLPMQCRFLYSSGFSWHAQESEFKSLLRLPQGHIHGSATWGQRSCTWFISVRPIQRNFPSLRALHSTHAFPPLAPMMAAMDTWPMQPAAAQKKPSLLFSRLPNWHRWGSRYALASQICGPCF